jgi:hypothetical protein
MQAAFAVRQGRIITADVRIDHKMISKQYINVLFLKHI